MKIMRSAAQVILTVTLVAVICFGQVGNPPAAAKPAAPAPSQAQPGPPLPTTISGVIDRQIGASEKQVIEAAEAMPEEMFNFTPESLGLPKSDFKGVRSFAVEVRHIATVNYVFWSAATGEPLPAGIKGPNGPEELKTKSEIVKFLKDSYALGHKAAATLTPDNLVEQLSFRNAKQTRLHLASFPAIHANDHYGQMVEYLRMNGIVPPASRPK